MGDDDQLFRTEVREGGDVSVILVMKGRDRGRWWTGGVKEAGQILLIKRKNNLTDQNL